MDYYEIFGFPIGLNVDPKQLNRQYIQLQKKYHPDFFTQSTDEEKATALERSSLINKAYKTFKDPDLTIKYFLEQKSIIEEGESYKLPPEFLMEVMELNELKMDGEPAEEILKKAREMEANLYNAFRQVLENYDEQTATKTDLLQIKDYYYKKKYIDRLLAE